MSNADNGKNGPQLGRVPLITSAALLGGGTVLVLAGLVLGGGHLVWATRQWIREMDVPPSELAKIKWSQARTAVSAGAAAWQNGQNGQQVTSESVS
jgi:hypothetical protein